MLSNMSATKWSAKQLESHCKAVRRLESVKDDTFAFLKARKYVTEHEVQQFALDRFRTHGLVKRDNFPLIVAFGPNSDDPHHFPKPKGSLRLRPNTLVMLDLWGNLPGSSMPFGDITWMAFHGSKVPAQIQKVFDTVIHARNSAIEQAKRKLRDGKMPTGAEIHAAAEGVIRRCRFGKYIKHRTGHSIGTRSPHGYGPHVNNKNDSPLLTNVGYTIEPGIYLPGRFGVRSEMNFVIQNGRFQPTTGLQKKLVLL